MADSYPPRTAAPIVEGLRACTSSGLTVSDVARRYRVSPDKVRTWIRRGELYAINTSSTMTGKPRFVIPPEALVQFERGRAAAQPKPAPRRRHKPPAVDYYPD